MHKFVSFLFALLLLTFSVLPTAQARPRHTTHSHFSSTSVTEYRTILTDHNPPTMTATYDSLSHIVAITPEVCDYTGYKPTKVALEFYTFDPTAHAFKAAKPADFFDLSSFNGTQDDVHLAEAPITSSTGTQAAFVFPLLGSVVVKLPTAPVHLLIVESSTYVPTGGGSPISKGPVFTTLLLEPPGAILLLGEHHALKRVR